jgi:hypothetical protein
MQMDYKRNGKRKDFIDVGNFRKFIYQLSAIY